MFFLVVLSCVALSQASQIFPAILRHAQPYNFGYAIRDHTSDQYRQEKGNGLGGVVGSYGFKDARGIVRNVNYVADHAGFRAQVNTNEPGTANQNPAAVLVNSHQPVVVKAVEPVRPTSIGRSPSCSWRLQIWSWIRRCLGIQWRRQLCSAFDRRSCQRIRQPIR
ncbi:Cuticle protein 10.9 like protein [Argiope bruennichi]|uniref:Cuticle protein 10.9 like protein n=1 Tax=Argiope bruennichi TaxID=94029 RepID=A0A8T0EH41_ARGBR|nr:Cuticle protein 10.9 like protein [Argiope bruennichi]